MFPRPKRHKILVTALLGLLWIISLVYGIRSLFSYETTPGTIGSIPQTWPAETKLVRSNDGATLVMLAHPHCPCTRATIGELAKIMAQTQGKLRAYVLFVVPHGVDLQWADTELRKTAAQIPGVTVVTDSNGEEAGRFGAKTSGHTLLFDSTGREVFSGGITAFRGHAGDNAGESAIVDLATEHGHGRNSEVKSTMVFGCPLEKERKYK